MPLRIAALTAESFSLKPCYGPPMADDLTLNQTWDQTPDGNEPPSAGQVLRRLWLEHQGLAAVRLDALRTEEPA